MKHLGITLSFILLLAASTCYGQATAYKFSFGPEEVPGFIKVDPSETYSSDSNYGFDFGRHPRVISRTEKKSFAGGFCTSDEPFFFSVALPEGNYHVRIITGDPEGESVTTIRTESRRLLFEKAVTRKGKYLTLEATVNIRIP